MIGPVAKPRTYSETPRVLTSRLRFSATMIAGIAVAKILLAIATNIVEMASSADIKRLNS